MERVRSVKHLVSSSTQLTKTKSSHVQCLAQCFAESERQSELPAETFLPAADHLLFMTTGAEKLLL